MCILTTGYPTYLDFMKNSTHFDVLVVYSAYAASSAKAKRKGSSTPFALAGSRAGYDNSYSYMLEKCQSMGLTAAFTTSGDITGPGECSCYWLFEGGDWIKVSESAKATVIFDKFSPFNSRQKRQRDLMFSCPKIQPFNEHGLYQLFFDKLTTYQELDGVVIPTVSVGATSNMAIERLSQIVKQHTHPGDFGEDFVLKNRHGSAGNHVYLIKAGNLDKIDEIMAIHKKVRFVLQPMVKFDKGYRYKEYSGKIEIRLIFMGDEVVQSYIRIAPKDSFLCNDHQGGKSLYITLADIPERVLNKAYAIAEQLPAHDSLYALDFLVSDNGNPYMLEGNTGPGLNWDPKNKIDEKKSHELIDVIVDELKKRVANHVSPVGYSRVVHVPFLSV